MSRAVHLAKPCSKTMLPGEALPTSNPIFVWKELELATELYSTPAFLWQQTGGGPPFKPTLHVPLPLCQHRNCQECVRIDLLEKKKIIGFLCGVSCQRGSWKVGLIHCFPGWWGKLEARPGADLLQRPSVGSSCWQHGAVPALLRTWDEVSDKIWQIRAGILQLKKMWSRLNLRGVAFWITVNKSPS